MTTLHDKYGNVYRLDPDPDGADAFIGYVFDEDGKVGRLNCIIHVGRGEMHIADLIIFDPPIGVSLTKRKRQLT